MTQTFFTIAELALHYGGIGGWATNKQRAKCKTFALLATIISKSGPETHRQSTDEHAAQLQRSFRREILYAR